MRWLILSCLVALCATQAPTAAPPPTPFVVPEYPIQKTGKYPDCDVEVIFLEDFSGSVQAPDKEKMKTFTQLMIYEIERNVRKAKFGLSFFFDGRRTQSARLTPRNATVNGVDTIQNLAELDNGTILNGQPGNTLLDVVAQLQTTGIGGDTPTEPGFSNALEMFKKYGDPAVPARFVLFISDGKPTFPYANATTDAGNNNPLGEEIATNLATERAAQLRNGTLVMTVGVDLEGNNDTQDLMRLWASEPKDILAQPNIEFDKLQELIPQILPLLCPQAIGEPPCLAKDATQVTVTAKGILPTPTLGCKFVNLETDDPDVLVKAKFVSAEELVCVFPETFFPGVYRVDFTIDGRGFFRGLEFKYGTVCFTEVIAFWYPMLFLIVLPFAFIRKKKSIPKVTEKVTPGAVRQAPAVTEEFVEYEEVEEVSAPEPPAQKWKIAPAAYIGFGRARMSVDWAGVAPASAPHEGIRKKVVVRKQTLSPKAGAGGSTPAAGAGGAVEMEDIVTEEVFVEEPDWVNGFLDQIANCFCCCCRSNIKASAMQ